MKEIVVVSGKGGTGKTSLVASLAVLAGESVLADCDVDAADLHLVLQPEIQKSEDFTGGKKAAVSPDKCSGCGRCHEVCRFGAITRDEGRPPAFAVDPVACEGCGVCSHFCPEKAIRFEPVVDGRWFAAVTPYGPMVHARLEIAAENSGKLVSLVRSEAKKIAEQKGYRYLLVDGPPGIGCPVIASVTGADAVVVVTEPTVAGENDLERVVALAGHFQIPVYLCVNKFDINPGLGEAIERRARSAGITLVGRIHYDLAVTAAQMRGVPVTAMEEARAAKDIRAVWNKLLTHVDTN
ncbi:MAG: ATP-binding protein [Peptococcaceae bacterium]|nr:ATP-binding protein [Peptococcaceae bacterium]